MTGRSRVASAALLVAALNAIPVAAQTAPTAPPPETPKKLKLKLPLDGILYGVGAVGLLVPELLKSHLAPTSCRICEGNPDGSVSVNGFDRGIRNGLVGALGVTPPAWATASNVMIAGILPALSIGEEILFANNRHFDRNIPIDVGVVGESVLLAAALDEGVKFVVGRQRPFVAYNSTYSAALRSGTTNDDNLSFFSGHSSAALAMTVAMSRVIQLRTGRTIGYWTLVPLGVLTSLMRIAADKHWATDVITGMAVGAIAGYFIPMLHQ